MFDNMAPVYWFWVALLILGAALFLLLWKGLKWVAGAVYWGHKDIKDRRKAKKALMNYDGLHDFLEHNKIKDNGHNSN